MSTKNAVGRPPKYRTKEEMQEKIDAYFEECEGKTLEDDSGNIVLNKFGNPIVINQRPVEWPSQNGASFNKKRKALNL